MTDLDQGSNAAGTYSLTESSSMTSTGTVTGNYVSGSYTMTMTTGESYSLTMTGSPGTGLDYTLTETGSLSSTTNETGNTVEGTYSQTVTGSDPYSMVETGTNTGGAFSETVAGTDSVTVVASGNFVNQIADQTITASGTYSRTDSGPGATLPSSTPSGSISYTLVASVDAPSGALSQSETGGDRYSLLEQFNNVARHQQRQQSGEYGLPAVWTTVCGFGKSAPNCSNNRISSTLQPLLTMFREASIMLKTYLV